MKTIGDAYMCVSGMPRRNPSHPVDMVLAAFEMLHAVEELGRREGSPGWKVRIGIHTGPVIAGVVGIKKFAFDVWGESVIAPRGWNPAGSPTASIFRNIRIRASKIFSRANIEARS